MTDDDDDILTDALTLLATDHEEVRLLFAEYDELVSGGADDDERQALAGEICDALTAHATAEEEIFYPALRAVLGDDEPIDEAEAEHASARAMIDRIREMDPSDDRYDDAVRVLGEAIEQHVQEEEDELFPKARDNGLDLSGLGDRIAARKEEVLAELGDDVPD